MNNIELLLLDGGSISIGAIDSFDCVAAAADAHNSLAMLVRREGETIIALLDRLDKAIAVAMDNGDIIDEVNR